MPYLQNVIDWIESEQFEYECDEDVNDAYERIEDEWHPNNRFSLPQLLGNEFPDLIVYLQEQIDDECEDDTEVITFPRTRAKADEQGIEDGEDEEIIRLERRAESLESEIRELEGREEGIIGRVKSFIKRIFRG